MNAKRNFGKRRVTAVRKNRKANPKPKQPSKSLTMAVKKIIHAQSESKSSYHQIDNVYFNSGINSTGDIQRIVPNVLKSIDENGRIGEQIRAQRLTVKGHVLMNSANSYSASRIAVRIMVVTPKALGWNDASTQSAWLNSLLVKGGTSVAFTGLISDLYANINSDFITTHYDKLMYLTLPYTNRVTTTGVTNVNTATEVAIDSNKATKFFSFDVKCKNRLIRYDSAYNTLQPTNFNPVFLVGYTHLDGSAADVVGTQIQVSYDSYLQYEDM